ESGGRDFYRWSAAAARNAGLTDEGRIQDAVRRAARMLVRFQATALFAAMDAAAQRLLEVPYSVLDAEGRLDAGIMDALWCDETAHWHLVEFKTDRIKDAHDLERQLQEHDYIEQVARYLAAAEHLLGRRPEPALCFLDVAGRVRLVTDRWDG
ncbi:MAG: hypothetical protein JXC32_19220, partial [Anaerolineae bacterium]|nr:hypothetical protein [Anaerolineae bacterium]